MESSIAIRLTDEERQWLTEHADIPRTIAYRYSRFARRRYCDWGDLYQLACVGAAEALIRWRANAETPAVRKSAFVVLRARRAVNLFLRTQQTPATMSKASPYRPQIRLHGRTLAQWRAAGRRMGLGFTEVRLCRRKGRAARPMSMGGPDDLPAFDEAGRELAHRAVLQAVGSFQGPARRAAAILAEVWTCTTRLNGRVRHEVSGETGLTRRQVCCVQDRLMARAKAIARRWRDAGGPADDANTGTLAGASEAVSGLGRADSTAGISGGLAAGAA